MEILCFCKMPIETGGRFFCQKRADSAKIRKKNAEHTINIIYGSMRTD